MLWCCRNVLTKVGGIVLSILQCLMHLLIMNVMLYKTLSTLNDIITVPLSVTTCGCWSPTLVLSGRNLNDLWMVNDCHIHTVSTGLQYDFMVIRKWFTFTEPPYAMPSNDPPPSAQWRISNVANVAYATGLALFGVLAAPQAQKNIRCPVQHNEPESSE